jgi:hypothetical protein
MGLVWVELGEKGVVRGRGEGGLRVCIGKFDVSALGERELGPDLAVGIGHDEVRSAREFARDGAIGVGHLYGGCDDRLGRASVSQSVDKD